MLSAFKGDFSQPLNVVVLTGAGISAESGLKTFRDNNGLWEQHSVQDVATPEAFNSDPALVYRFYNQRRRQLLGPDVSPNKAHFSLARLENTLAGTFTLVTQNVDDLHQRAGSKHVLHMHGSLLSARCLNSGEKSQIVSDLDHRSRCSCCPIPSTMRPDIVWFGEIPQQMEKLEKALAEADLFVSIGTSGSVYPAAGFVSLANRYGAHSVELNMEPSLGHSEFAEKYYGPASKVVEDFVVTLIGDVSVD